MRTRKFHFVATLLFVIPANTIQAQMSIIACQSRITANFNGAGQSKFALGASTNVSIQATAVATNTSGFIIAPIDEGGVGLAAIQGLDQRLKEKEAELQNLEKKLDELQAAVNQLAARK
jgi:hypothetical protein